MLLVSTQVCFQTAPVSLFPPFDLHTFKNVNTLLSSCCSQRPSLIHAAQTQGISTNSSKLCAAAAAKPLQSCPTLCDPIDGSPPGSSVPGFLQARILEWVAISIDNACKHAKSLQSCPTLCDPMDSSPPGSPVHGILQARILEWVATSLSSKLYTNTQIKLTVLSNSL